MVTSYNAAPDGRAPSQTFPTFRLRSFDAFSPDSCPSPVSATRASLISPFAPVLGDSLTQPAALWERRTVQSGVSGKPFADNIGPPPSNSWAHASQSLDDETESSQSSARPQIPAPLRCIPPDISLPQIPNLSPISPIGLYSTSGRSLEMDLGPPLPPPSTASSCSWHLAPSTSPTGPHSAERPRGRPLGPSVTINVPSPLTPSSSTERNRAPSPTILLESPMPVRRTNVEMDSRAYASPARLPDRMGILTPPLAGSPEVSARRSSLERGVLSMSVAKLVHLDDEFEVARDGSPGKLEKQPSAYDLSDYPTRGNSDSLTPRRSLPRPPTLEALAQPSIPSLRSTSMSIPAGAQPSVSQRAHASITSSTWPPIGVPRTPLAVPDTPQRALANAQHRSLAQAHQTTNSASSLPVVAGLADAGPYPSSSTPTMRQSNMSAYLQGGAGMGRPAQAGPSRTDQARGPTGVPLIEEVCLECMMRDRDLADVEVRGDGVWGRSSDADWDELRWREESLLQSLGKEFATNRSVPSLDHSDSESADHSTTSPPSTGNSLDNSVPRQRTAGEQRKRQARRIRTQQVDRRVISVGWRGFRWEEGSTGEGLPAHFRGGRGGALTESGIKAVMHKVGTALESSLKTDRTHRSSLRRPSTDMTAFIPISGTRHVVFMRFNSQRNSSVTIPNLMTSKYLHQRSLAMTAEALSPVHERAR